MRFTSKLLAILIAATLLATLMPAAQANPAIPYCPGTANPIPGIAPTPVTPDVCEAATGRVFPEAILDETYVAQGATGQATDYVGFPEFEAGLFYLESLHPEYITVHTVGQSAGLCSTPACSEPDRFPIYMVELTNEESPMPLDERQSLLFMLSIHGVEKGGREGGFRVLEDLVKGISIGSEVVQDGAGLPSPLLKGDGSEVETYQDYLDFMRVFLLFPNADGWMHDELPYAAVTAPSCGSPPNGVLFCRTNGNGVDLNRQAPTVGWQNPNRDVVGQPEAIGYYSWMASNNITWSYGIDIHGMLNHENFAAIMMPAGAMTPQEMQRSVRLATTVKDRLNNDPHFDEWRELFANAETVQGAVNEQGENVCIPEGGPGFLPDCAAPGSALANAGSSTFAEYYTVIDAIGYTDSGFNGDFFAQNVGLNAPGYDIELAYNHVTVDSQYEAGAKFNDYHVKTVREIVKSFLDAAALDVKISFETNGLRTMYVEPSFVATNMDDEQKTPGGWADENDGDDLWDYGEDQPFYARPAKYWEDLMPFVRNGDAPGTLIKTTAPQVNANKLASFDTVVIPGSAIRDLENSPASLNAIKAWVEAGGNLVLTDEALRFFDLAGITQDAVAMQPRYMGGIAVDLEHPMLAKVRGGVKQMYEPTPLGFEEGANAAPNWAINTEAFAAIGGDVAGRECGTSQLSDKCLDSDVALGVVALGGGQIQFMGALLPDPTEEFYHPYGLDPYATTYSGNQILRNMLGWQEIFSEAPVVITESGELIDSPNEPVIVTTGPAAEEDQKKASALPILLVLVGLGIVARRRW